MLLILARTTAIWLREVNPSLVRMCATWLPAVRSEITSRAAICRLVRPSATSRATSASRADRPPSPGPRRCSSLALAAVNAVIPRARTSRSLSAGEPAGALLVARSGPGGQRGGLVVAGLGEERRRPGGRPAGPRFPGRRRRRRAGPGRGHRARASARPGRSSSPRCRRRARPRNGSSAASAARSSSARSRSIATSAASTEPGAMKNTGHDHASGGPACRNCAAASSG